MEKTKNFALRISPELFERLARRAEKNNRSINAEINTIIENALDAVIIPVGGTINDDGTVTFNAARARKWASSISIKEEQDRR